LPVNQSNAPARSDKAEQDTAALAVGRGMVRMTKQAVQGRGVRDQMTGGHGAMPATGNG
jgi:hypothetical protein